MLLYFLAMFGKAFLYILAPAGMVLLGYYLQVHMKKKFTVPLESSPPDPVMNLTLLGTNDLHSTVTGLGLKSYPETIRGGYGKLVYLINSIR